MSLSRHFLTLVVVKSTDMEESAIRMGSARLLICVLYFLLTKNVNSFAMSPSRTSSNNNSKEIYGVKGSGWTAPEWNWGYAQGTGHTCAAICREMYATREARQRLVDNLLEANLEKPSDVEEIKLILALEWQRGRWDGSDGGPGGYSQVLSSMAQARRYEIGSDDECLQRLVQDMADPERFRRLRPMEDDVREMNACLLTNSPEEGFRKCSGLVLKAMGFIERGV